MPTVSVVMSTYNDAEYLKESIDSVLCQEFQDFEFVIVNDGSPDFLTRQILAHYEQDDNRIRIIEKENEGLTKALIEGCETATAKYVARIDVGDVMAPNRLGKQIQILEENQDCVFVSCHTEFCGPKWETLWFSKPIFTFDSPVSTISSDPQNGSKPYIPHHGSVMFRKTSYDCVGGYRKEFYCGQDWDLWFRLIQIGRFYNIREVLYRARIFPESISMTQKKYQDLFSKYSKNDLFSRLRDKDEHTWIEKASSLTNKKKNLNKDSNKIKNFEPGFYFIGEALRRNGDIRCRSYFYSAIRQFPFSLRSYIRLYQSFAL